MTTPTGTIGLSDVNIELGNSSTAQINMNMSTLRTLAGVSSGQISMSNLRGKNYDWWQDVSVVQAAPVQHTTDAKTMPGSGTLSFSMSGVGGSGTLTYRVIKNGADIGTVASTSVVAGDTIAFFFSFAGVIGNAANRTFTISGVVDDTIGIYMERTA